MYVVVSEDSSMVPEILEPLYWSFQEIRHDCLVVCKKRLEGAVYEPPPYNMRVIMFEPENVFELRCL